MTILSTPEYRRTKKPGERYCANDGCRARQAPWENTARLRRDNPGPYCESCADLLSVKAKEEEATYSRRTGTGTLKLTGLRRVMDRREITYGQLAIACEKPFKEAKRFPLTASSLSNWACGKYLAPPEDAEILASVLKCSVEDLTRPPAPKDPRVELRNLRSVKEQSGKSWAQLSLRLGVSVPAIKHWAGENHTCPKKQAEKIADYFEVTLEELIGIESGLSPDSIKEEV